MIITVTEEQKKIIESQGYMVIQYKKWCYDIEPYFKQLLNKCIDFYERVILFFQDTARRLSIAITPLFDSFKELADRIRESTEFINRNDFYIDEKPKYKFIRSIGKLREQNFNNRVIYHRCRDRC